MRGRRCELGQAHFVSARGEAEARRDGVVLLHRVPLARRARPRECEGDEGQAPGEDDGPEDSALRRQADVLGRVQGDGQRLKDEETIMQTQVQAYLFFDGRCEEALQYYSKHLGAKIEMLMRFKENPEPPPPGMNAPGDKVMHAAFRIGETQVLASDGMCGGNPKFEGFSLTISARDDAEAKRIFNALADGGQVRMPLTKTFFASSFGMLADRFGVGWMVMAEKQQA